ncbi:MAG: rhodanese-like domain-containing protein [Desulfuromonadales bacterium]|nr:MAG: rhodanese-like domain-containing protein [Desulfuromonadales bacterium]
MKTDAQRLAAEMAAICLIAAVIGVAWNHRLLLDVFQGRGVQTQKTPVSPAAGTTPAASPTAIPMPLGLMQVKELFDSQEAVIIDARDRETFRKGHIKGAIPFPVGDADGLIPSFSAKTPKEKLIVVYCGGFDCHDSRLLGEQLISANFNQVFVFEGGYPEWQDAGYPIARGEN